MGMAFLFLFVPLYFNQQDKAPDDIPHYEIQSKVQDKVKVTLTPDHLVANQPLSFKLHLESYENTDLIMGDISDRILLTDAQNTPYRPEQWRPDTTGTYHQSGTLYFPASPDIQLPISLSIYLFEPLTFTIPK